MSGAPSFLPKRLRQPLRDVGQRLHRAIHADDVRVVGQHLRRLELARVPAGRLVRRVLHQPFEQADVALHVGVAEADHRAGVVADLAQHRIDHLDVRAVAVDEEDLVEAVMDQAARDVVHQRLQRRRADRDRAAALAGAGHVLRRVAGPDRRRVQHVVDLGDARGDLDGRDRVGAQRQVRAVLLGAGHRHEHQVADLQVGLDVRIGQVGHVVRRQLDGHRDGHVGGSFRREKRDEPVGHGEGELGRVDVQRMGRDRDVGAQVRPQRRRGSRRRRPGPRTRRPARSESTGPAVGTMTSIGPGRLVQPLGEDPPELHHLVGQRPHQRELRIVRVDRPPLQARRHFLGPAVHGEVDAAGHDDLRQAEPADAPQPLGAAAWKPPTSSSVSSSVVKSMTPTNRPSAASSSIAGPPTPFEWKITLSRPCRGQRVADRHHRLGGVAEHGDRHARPVRRRAAAGWPWCSMPAIAAATLSKIVVLIGFSPRMSTTECTTITSRVPTSGPKRRWPDAIGVTMIFGTPIGSDSMALAPSTAPSAPPRHSTPSSRPSRIEVEREPLQAEQHAVHRLAAAAGLAQRVDRRAAEPRDLGARHVGHDVERPAEDAGVGDDASTGRAPAGDRGRTRSPAPSCRACRCSRNGGHGTQHVLPRAS